MTAFFVMAQVSVMLPYHTRRRRALERCLFQLRRQTYPDYDVWVLDDGSLAEERIQELCSGPIRYHRVRPPGAELRSSNTAWNVGYRELAEGEFIILTHPDYLVPPDAIARLVEAYDGSARLGPRAYALSPFVTNHLDDYPWMDNLDVLAEAPNFWTFLTPWGWRNEQAKEWCHHFAFTGQTRDAWDLTDFIPVTDAFHMNDSWIVHEEVAMGRPPRAVEFAVYHQDHTRRQEGPVPEMSARVRRIRENRNE